MLQLTVLPLSSDFSRITPVWARSPNRTVGDNFGGLFCSSDVLSVTQPTVLLSSSTKLFSTGDCTIDGIGDLVVLSLGYCKLNFFYH